MLAIGKSTTTRDWMEKVKHQLLLFTNIFYDIWYMSTCSLHLLEVRPSQTSRPPRALVGGDSHALFEMTLLFTKRYRSRLGSRKTPLSIQGDMGGGGAKLRPKSPHQTSERREVLTVQMPNGVCAI